MNDPAEEFPLTALIQSAANDDAGAKDELYCRVYDELRTAAQNLMRHEKKAGELQATAIVNEVVLRFERGDVLKSVTNRRVFFSVANVAMRQILIDHYRRRKKLVDSPDRLASPLDAAVQWIENQMNASFEDLQLALQVLAEHSQRQHDVVMHRFFGGFTIQETADLLSVSVQTVERDWRLARVRLLRELREE